MRTLITALLIMFLTTAIGVASPRNSESIARLLIGKWQATKHLTHYLPNHTFLMDPEPGTPPRGTWRLEGDRLIQTFSEGGTDTCTILSINKSKMIVQSTTGKQYTLKRVH